MHRKHFTRLSLAFVGAGILVSCGKSGPKPLRVGMELSTPPFEMQGADGTPDGTSVRLAEALAASMGRPLQLEVMAFSGLMTALKTRQVDMVISSMTATDERRQSIDFSDPYCRIGLALLVGKASPVQAAADLNAPGRKIVVRMKTTGEQVARETFPQATLIAVDSESAGMLEVVSGKADAFIYDQISVLRFHAAQPEQTRTLLQPLRQDNWAIGLPQGQTELKAQVNAFLSKARTDGWFDRVADQYLAKEKAALKAQGVPFIFE